MKKKLLFISFVTLLSCLISCTKPNNEDLLWIKMFYWDHQADFFLVKEIPVKSLEEQQVLNAIIKDNDFIGKNIIPHASIVVENNLATIDIPSIKINANPAPGDKIVADSLSSLAYTLCVNPELEVHNVQYLLDGYKIDTIGPSCTNRPLSLPSNWADVYMKLTKKYCYTINCVTVFFS